MSRARKPPSTKGLSASSIEPAVAFRHKLRERFFLRFHMTLIICAVLGTGVITSKFLRGIFHVRSMPLRYGIAVVLSYGVFFGLVRLWLWYVDADAGHRSRATDRDGGDSGDVVEGVLETTDLLGGGGGGGSSGGGSSSGGGWDLGDGEGLVLIVLGILIAVICGAGVYLVWEAPAILGEVAFQMVLAGSLRRSAYKLKDPDWSGSLFSATSLPFGIVLTMAIIFGFVAQGVCPAAIRMADVIPHCVEAPVE